MSRHLHLLLNIAPDSVRKMFKYLWHVFKKVLVKYAKDTEYKIMNGFVIFSVSIFLYFSFHIFDQGACSNIVAPSINRDPSKTPTFFWGIYFMRDFMKFCLFRIEPKNSDIHFGDHLRWSGSWSTWNTFMTFGLAKDFSSGFHGKGTDCTNKI